MSLIPVAVVTVEEGCTLHMLFGGLLRASDWVAVLCKSGGWTRWTFRLVSHVPKEEMLQSSEQKGVRDGAECGLGWGPESILGLSGLLPQLTGERGRGRTAAQRARTPARHPALPAS